MPWTETAPMKERTRFVTDWERETNRDEQDEAQERQQSDAGYRDELRLRTALVA